MSARSTLAQLPDSTCFRRLCDYLHGAAGCWTRKGGLHEYRSGTAGLKSCITCHLAATCLVELATTTRETPRNPAAAPASGLCEGLEVPDGKRARDRRMGECWVCREVQKMCIVDLPLAIHHLQLLAKETKHAQLQLLDEGSRWAGPRKDYDCLH